MCYVAPDTVHGYLTWGVATWSHCMTTQGPWHTPVCTAQVGAMAVSPSWQGGHKAWGAPRRQGHEEAPGWGCSGAGVAQTGVSLGSLGCQHRCAVILHCRDSTTRPVELGEHGGSGGARTPGSTRR